MSPTIAELRAINPQPHTMSHTRGVLKVPVFLKLFEHRGWEGAKKKWKGHQTYSACATFLSQIPDEETAKFIKLLVDDDDFPSQHRCLMFSMYRAENRARAAVPHKGRLPTKNVMIVDPFGSIRDQIPSGLYRAGPITSNDIERMVEEDNAD